MNKIGFQNFRRFKHFPIIEYGGITFLVGPNNSGKSTLVKALLLFNNYIKGPNFKKFYFGNFNLEDVNIINYGRAKYNNAESNQINFQFQFGDYLVLLTMSGEEDKSFANVVLLEIHDYSTGFTFTFDVLTETIKIVMEEVSKENSINESIIKNLEFELKNVNDQITNLNLKKTSREYIDLNALKDKLESNLKNLLKDEILNFPNQSIIEGNFDNFAGLEEIVENFLQKSQERYNNEYIQIQQGNETPIGFQDLKSFNEYGLIIIYEGIFNEILNALQTSSLTYIKSTTNKQSSLFFIRDKNNSLSQAIHEFRQLNITEGEVEYQFVLKWMREFGIGENFNIQIFAGEAYEMTIKTELGTFHLADYGMGSLQIMSVLIKLACEIKEANLEKTELGIYMVNFPKKTIIFEEPELNLHPAFQSKLTDVFFDVHQRFGIDFIIETHSEYILRRSQVIVAENEFEIAPNENPFSVYYFPKEEGLLPYQLKYQPDGTFDRNFGTGFFDTASLDTLKLLRIKREKKA